MALQKTQLEVGTIHSEVVVENLTRTQIVQYAGASGDYNPIHSDEVFIKEVVGYPSVFAHGMLTMGMTAMMLTNYVGDGQLTDYGVRFTKQVFPGDDLTAKCEVTGFNTSDDGDSVVELKVETLNQRQEVVLSGYAKAKIDG